MGRIREQTEDPSTSVDDSGGQFTQPREPALPWTVAIGQRLQGSKPSFEKLPATHCPTHIDAPVPLLYKPPPHNWQDVEPIAAVNDPLEHATHGEDPLEEKNPGEHNDDVFWAVQETPPTEPATPCSQVRQDVLCDEG